MWWLDINVSDDRAASIFRVQLHGDRKVVTDIGRFLFAAQFLLGLSMVFSSYASQPTFVFFLLYALFRALYTHAFYYL
jgi:hypothetical protein